MSEVMSVKDIKEMRMRQAMTANEQANYIRHQTEGHLATEEIGNMAQRADVKTALLTHLGPRLNSDDYTAWEDEVKKFFSGQVLIAQDLMEF